MNDIISRQAAIDALNVGAELLKRVLDDADVVGAEREKYEWGLGLIESYISDMKELPSAQPERKKGMWIKLDMHAHIADHKCTACGEECYVPTCMGEPMYIYCPNCGAKMDTEEESEEVEEQK